MAEYVVVAGSARIGADAAAGCDGAGDAAASPDKGHIAAGVDRGIACQQTLPDTNDTPVGVQA